MAALEDAFVEFAGRAETADRERRRSRRAAASAGRLERQGPPVRLRARTPTSGSPTWRSTPTGPRRRFAGADGRVAAGAAPGAGGAQPAERGGRARPPRTRSAATSTAPRRRWRTSPASAAASSGWASTAASRWWTTTRTTRRSSCATLAAARQAFPGRRLVAVFQPHLYSRTAAHGAAMGEALAAADLVVVTEVYAAREQPIAGRERPPGGRGRAHGAGADALFEPTRGGGRAPGLRGARARRRGAHARRRRHHARGTRARAVAGRGLKTGWKVLGGLAARRSRSGSGCRTRSAGSTSSG